MPGPLLVTKLYIPPLRSELVPRPRLVERLNQAVGSGGPVEGSFARRLTLVSAPAGFGKTTLLSEWLHSKREATPPLQAVWLSLDSGDNDPVRFLAYFVAALQGLKPGLGEAALSAYRSPQPPPTEAVLVALINELADLPADLRAVLVLDDYHLIEALPVHDLLAFLLEHLPLQMHLVIATRADPPLPLARLRARGQLTELRAADLRFAPDEAAAFLNRAMGLDLAAGEIAALEARTEGWIAGLQLAALSLERRRQGQGDPDLSAFVEAFAGDDRYVVDYLVEEVIQGQPEPVQAFLLRTSILSRLCAPLCDAVTGQADGWATLQALERANLFVVALDQKQVWYRYHQLFADLLRQRLERTHAKQVPALHRRASAWYEQNGWEAEAIDHALAAVDFERAAQLIVRSLWGMVAQGERATVLGWLDALPGEMVRSRPRLCLAAAWSSLAAMELDAVEPRLQQAERALRASPSPAQAPALLGEIATIRTTLASLRGDVPRIIELAQQALAHLPEEQVFLRGTVTNALGTGYEASGETAAAGQAFAQAADLCRRAGDPVVALVSLCNLGRTQELQGRLCQAQDTYLQAIRFAAEQGEPPLPVTGLAHVGLGALRLEWNDLPAAACHLQQGLELGRRLGIVEIQVVGYTILAQVYQAQGERSAAVEAIGEVDQLAQRYQVSAGTLARIAASQARLWIVRGELAAAARWARQSGLDVDVRLEYPREFEQITMGWLLLAQGEPDKAAGLLERLLAAAEAHGRLGSAIEILTLLALARQGHKETERALAALTQALALAEPEGYVRTFVDKGRPVGDLLRQVTAPAVAPSYLSKLLAAFGSPASAAQSLVEPLSERELEVLRWIAAGLSNREIAAELVITEGTAKWHVNNILSKLQVNRRTEAVARARELGLL